MSMRSLLLSETYIIIVVKSKMAEIERRVLVIRRFMNNNTLSHQYIND
jgi:hypothetical protein